MGGTCCVVSRERTQVGRSLLWLDGWTTSSVLKAVEIAETKLGKPGSAVEVFVTLKNEFSTPIRNMWEVAAVLCSLFREDWIFTNSIGSHWTRSKKEGYSSYSEIFKAKFPGYKLDSRQRVMSDTAKTTNFKKLTDMLKSKVEADFTAFAEHYAGNEKGHFKFLDGEPLEEKVAFNTFPRSGNSMLRKQLELITGISTGATVSLNTSTSLQITGLAGEEIVDDRVFIIKAHHPGLFPGVIEFDSTKVLMCVRNPLDVLVSFASLVNTLSHTAEPEFSYATDFPEWWDWWVKDQAEKHANYFNTMIDACTTGGKNPVYITRFEDLLSNKQEELTGVMKFLLGVEDLTGTNAERRIHQVCNLPKESTQPYQIKSTTGKKGAHVDKYN